MTELATIERVPADLWEPMQRLTRDMRDASKLLGRQEARYFVDLYYQVQHFRIAAAAQVRSADDEPNRVLTWAFDTMRFFEGDIQRSLGAFAGEYMVGRWLQSICGIGPVISAGLLAHLDINPWSCVKDKKKCRPDEPCGEQCRHAPCKTAGHFWRFAGLDPSQKWEKKTKRPWNADLKTLVAFKLGECFVKVQNNKNDFYGGLFRTRKDTEIERNERGLFSDQAASALEGKRIGKDTEAFKHYSAGKLPPAHIHARARRWTVKLFLSHLHHVMHVDFFGAVPPVPYSFEHCEGDHRHFIEPPNWPFDGGGRSLKELYATAEASMTD